MTGPCTFGFWMWVSLGLITTTARVTGQVCQDPLGMENGGIPDGSITASSIWGYNHEAYRARLNGVGGRGGCWAAGTNNIGQWLQVFTGNNDMNTPVTNLLDNPIYTRYVRFNPQAWYAYISMRVEILGCSTNILERLPISRYRLRYQPADGSGSSQDLSPAPEAGATSAALLGLMDQTEYSLTLTSFGEDDQPNGVINRTYTTVCQDPLGMESGAIPDDSITASSFVGATLEPYRARLNGVAGNGGWAVQTNVIGEWLQVDLGEMKLITGTITQGRAFGRDLEQWVKSYKIQHSADGAAWTTYAGSDGVDKVFTGNTDTNTPVTNLLDNPVDARYVRFYPQSWNEWITMRVEILGCSTGSRFLVLLGLTLNDAGMDHLTVSWTVVGNLPISRYRLRYQPADGSGSYQDLSPAPGTGATSATVLGLLAETEYSLTLTSFDEDDKPNGEISGTYTTDAVIVNVECDQDSMSLSIPRAALPAVNVENLHLLDPDCGATEDEDEDVFKLETHLQECGTRQETSGDDKFIFSNEIIANQVTYDNGAVRNQPVNLPFQCEFLRQRNVSGGAIMYNIPAPRVQIVDANNSFIIEMHMYSSGDFIESYESSDFPIQVSPSDRLHFGLSVASPLDNLELFARDCVSTPTTSPDDYPRVSIIDDGCQVDQTLQKDNNLSNDKALYYSVDAFTFPNALDPSLVYFHCTMIICFKDDPDSRCKQGCIPPAARRRRAVSDGTETRVRRESNRDKQVDITQGPFQVQSGEEAGTGPAGVPLGTAVGAAVGVAGIMVLLIVAGVLVKKRGGLALGRKKRDNDTVGLDNYAFQTWGKMSKTGIVDTKA
ncbi:PREDICTED: uncharacterized protein LOC109471335 [Branchiostoma belcheri]|uniref:Uncharacterized protein LOC109471335 n=1 Tax=Branchiostoma belcheri TaxID=7741 RepID=A0A6P4YP68_BRABE|nr:PREDICTED: uncharacterized protein LOC109471335 [Branchiostoma belcheri]